MPAIRARSPSPELPRETRIRHALAEVENSSTRPSTRELADRHKLPHTTVNERLSGRRTSRKEAAARRQKLSKPFEDRLRQYCLECQDRNLPLASTHIEDAAVALLIAQSGNTEATVTRRWVRAFAERNGLKTVKAKPSKSNELAAYNAESANTLFDTLQKLMARSNVRFKDVYNMDETGFNLAEKTHHRVYVDVFGNHRGKVQDLVAHDNITQVEVLRNDSQDPLPMPAFTIAKERLLTSGAFRDRVDYQQLRFFRNLNGYQNSESACAWLEAFNVHTTPSDDRWRLLLLDNHRSHASIDFLKLAKQSRIEICFLPANTTSWLQPLDVAGFGPLKHAYKKLLKDVQLAKADKCPLGLFLASYPKLRENELTKQHVWRGFERCGIGSHGILRREVLRHFDRQPSSPERTIDEVSAVLEGAIRTPTKSQEARQLQSEVRFADRRSRLTAAKIFKFAHNQAAEAALRNHELSRHDGLLADAGLKVKKRTSMRKTGFMQHVHNPLDSQQVLAAREKHEAAKAAKSGSQSRRKGKNKAPEVEVEVGEEGDLEESPAPPDSPLASFGQASGSLGDK